MSKFSTPNEEQLSNFLTDEEQNLSKKKEKKKGKNENNGQNQGNKIHQSHLIYIFNIHSF